MKKKACILFLISLISSCCLSQTVNIFLPFKQDNKWNYLTPSRERIRIDSVSELVTSNKGVLIYRQGDKTGIIKNKVVKIKMEYREIFQSSDGYLTTIGNNNKYGLLNKNGDIIFEPKFQKIKDINEALCIVFDGRQWMLIDTIGTVIFSQPKEIYYLPNGYYKITQKNKYGLIDKKGKEIIKPVYDDIVGFSEGLCGVKYNNKYGFINEQLQVKIINKFDNVGSFSHGFCPVMIKDVTTKIEKWGLIDMQGNIVIEPKYTSIIIKDENAILFSENLLSEKWGIINKSGRMICESKFDLMEPINDSYNLAYLNRKCFIVDNKGNDFFTYDNCTEIVMINESIISFFINGRSYKYYQDNTNVMMGYFDLNTKAIILSPTR